MKKIRDFRGNIWNLNYGSMYSNAFIPAKKDQFAQLEGITLRHLDSFKGRYEIVK